MGFAGGKIIRIIPDQQGRGGSKTSLTTQSINLDIRLAQNVFVNYGRWRQATQPVLADDFPPYPNTFHSYSLHNFASFDTSNANLPPVNRLLSHNQMNNGEQHIGQHNPLATIKSYAPPGALDTVAATFLNIKNRCFICWGATPNFIYTGLVTYDVGIDAPQTAATYTFGDESNAYVFAQAGSTAITFIQGAVPFSDAITSVTINSQNYQTAQPHPVFTGPYAAPGTITGTATSNTLTVVNGKWPNLGYGGLLLSIAGEGTNFRVMSYQVVGNDTQVTLNLHLGADHSGSAYSLSGTQLILASPFADNSTSIDVDNGFIEITDTIATMFYGPLSWDASPPQYAYAYYDYPGMIEPGLATATAGTNTITITGANWGPVRYVLVNITIGSDTYQVVGYSVPVAGTTVIQTNQPISTGFTNQPYTLSGKLAEYGTGHISNISPVTTITEQNIKGVSVVLGDIIPSGSADQPRFNKIQIFRSILAGGGAVYWPLDPSVGLLDNVGTAPLSFTDIYDDSFLLQAGGFQAPTVQNRKPPKFAHSAYWDSRVWGNPVNDPSAIVFSGDSVQILFGVAEECYPSENILRIPSDDGRVTGMALMGPIMVTTTERYAYYVSGTGDTSNPYRLVRFSTLMFGVGDKQMVEFAGATTEDSDLLIYVGKDHQFYITAPSVGNITISDPVQDIFNSGIGIFYDRVRVANIAIRGNQYLIVGAPFVSYTVMVYDWKRKIWTNHTVGQAPQAFCTLFGSTNPVRFLYLINGEVFEWLGENNTLGVTGFAQSFIETMPLSGDRKSRHRLEFIRLYVSDATEDWTAVVRIDEGFGTLATFIQEPDPLRTIQPPGSIPIDNPNAKELVYFPQSDPARVLDGYRFQARILWPNSETVRELYAIELCLTDMEPPEQLSE